MSYICPRCGAQTCPKCGELTHNPGCAAADDTGAGPSVTEKSRTETAIEE
jgi:hypothetical protein